ncbi:MAG: translocation/assembly module TamB domain-containing protein [Micavibrio sp.]
MVRFLAMGFASLAAFFILFLIGLQIILIAGINILNTGAARDFAKTQIESILQDSGYSMDFSNFYYDPIRGFTIHDALLADTEGTLATLDRASVDITFAALFLRRLDITANAGTLHIIRLPEAAGDSGETQARPSEAFTIGDIFFRTIKINPLTIDRLHIGEDVAGGPLDLSPTLKAELTAGDKITLEASLWPQARGRYQQAALPDRISLLAFFTQAEQQLEISNFDIISADYKINGQGKALLAGAKDIEARISAAYPDLKPVTGGNFESASLNGRIEGTIDLPHIAMDGILSTALLKEKGLDDIVLSLMADDDVDGENGNQAALDIRTSYHSEPIKLQAKASYDEERIHFSPITGEAPSINLTGTGSLSFSGMVLDGKAALRLSDLSHYKELTRADIAGSIKIDADFSPSENGQAAAVKAALESVRYEELRLGKADIDLLFGNLFALWPEKADIRLSSLKSGETITIESSHAAFEKALEDTYKLTLQGKGTMGQAFSVNGEALLSGLANPVPAIRDIDASISLGRSGLRLMGSFNEDNVALSLKTQDFRGRDIPAAIPSQFENLRLTLNGDITGNPSSPLVTAALQASGLDAGQYNDLTIHADADYRDSMLKATLSAAGTGVREMKGNASLPFSFSLYPFSFAMDENARLDGKLAANVDIEPIAALFLPPAHELSGALRLDASIGGSPQSPTIDGQASIANGAFEDEINGITLSSITASAAFNRNELILNNLSATDGERGSLTAQGRVSLGGGGNSNLSLTAKDFHAPKRDLANGRFDASLSLGDTDGGYLATGTIDIAEMNITIPENFQSDIPELNIVEAQNKSKAEQQAAVIALDIKIEAPNQIFVRGWGLDAEFGGNLDITGAADAPQIHGNLESRRGRYEQFSKRFTLERAHLRFQGDVPPSPYLDVEATIPAGDVTASILLTGPVRDPSIKFASAPGLPEDEVLARILFGRDTSRISPYQAVQLAQTIQKFSGQSGGGIGFDPLGLIRSATGLDDISVEMDESGQANVEAGKYLTDKVYLELESGTAAGSGAASIQIELTPSINVKSKIGQDAQGGAGIFWQRDY